MFGLFDVPERKRFGIFTGQPNQMKEPGNPQAGQHPHSHVSSIVLALERIPLWFSGLIKPELNPVIESSLYWPLNIQIRVDNFDSGSLLALSPPEGKHWLIVGQSVAAGGSAATAIFRVALLPSGVDNSFAAANAYCFFQYNLRRTNIAGADLMIPIINGTFSQYGAATFIDAVSGVRPIYLHSGLKEIFALENIAAPVNNVVRTMYLELPENQPFGNLAGVL